MSILSDYKDLIATALILAALVILAFLHVATFADVYDLFKMIATFWFFRGGVGYVQGALARLQAPTPVLPPTEEEKHA